MPITYRFQGAVCNQFANEPSKKNDGVIDSMQRMAKSATQNGDDCYCPFATSSQKGQSSKNATVTQESHINDTENQNVQLDDSDVMMYPRVEDKAVDEYDPTDDIFPKIMPWLFPGGVGGPYDKYPKKTIVARLGKNLLLLRGWTICQRQNLPFLCLELFEQA